jgi:prefoldin subunit 5
MKQTLVDRAITMLSARIKALEEARELLVDELAAVRKNAAKRPSRATKAGIGVTTTEE